MLLLTRKIGEAIILDDDIEITLMGLRLERVFIRPILSNPNG